MLDLTRKRTTVRGLVPLTILLGVAGWPAVASAEVPPRTWVGQTLEVPDADLERGQIFYLLPGQDSQVTVTSTAPLQRTVLTTSRAVGWVVADFDPEASDRPILGGVLRVPVASLVSASPAVDAMVRGADYLDAAAHPEMTFELTAAEAVEKLASDDDNVFPYRTKLRGKLTVRGVTQDVEMAAEASFLLSTFATYNRFVGDLLTIAGSFEVDAASFGWELPRGAAGLVEPKLGVDVFLVGSTMSPEKNLDPKADLERWRAEQRYLTLARDFGDGAAAAEQGEKYLEKHGGNAAALTALARTILDEPGLASRDLALARRLAQRAGALAAGDAAVGETLARLAALRGDPPAED